jgi:hypothetical protein
MRKLITTCCIAAGFLLPMAMPSTVQAAPYEHPEIRQAIRALENARAHLVEAKHDFNGHREEALHAVDAALEQLKICMKYE